MPILNKVKQYLFKSLHLADILNTADSSNSDDCESGLDCQSYCKSNCMAELFQIRYLCNQTTIYSFVLNFPKSKSVQNSSREYHTIRKGFPPSVDRRSWYQRRQVVQVRRCEYEGWGERAFEKWTV